MKIGEDLKVPLHPVSIVVKQNCQLSMVRGTWHSFIFLCVFCFLETFLSAALGLQQN